jgi:hypothetical protein
MLQLEHLNHWLSCLGAGVLGQQDSTTIMSHREADSGAELAIEDHVIELL